MNILVGCEESQTVCIELRKRGHNAFSCDLKECSGGHPEWHFKMDVFKAIAGGMLVTQLGEVVEIRKWDMGIFFPDCTFLTCSAEWAYKEQPPLKSGKLVGLARQQARAEAYEFFMALWNCGIQKIGMENPVGVMSTYFRKPDQIIQPYEFGNNASKSTCLWLKNLPTLKKDSDLYVTPRTVCSSCSEVQRLPTHMKISLKDGCLKCGNKVSARWANQTDSGQNKLAPSAERAKLRSKTYPGIAKAMAEQWG